jgi:long-chain acyl-CoA synthetase
MEEAAVVVVPNRHRGPIIKAFVRLKQDDKLKPGSLRTYLKDNLAPFQMPWQIEFRNEFPRKFMGKLFKKYLIADELASKETEKIG